MEGRRRATTYDQWLKQEALPVVGGHGVTDLAALELAPWGRLGGRGSYIDLEGMEGLTGMYVGEIAPGRALEPEKHIYDELIYFLTGRGRGEVWGEGANSGHSAFEWQEGSLFAPPANTWHRLVNESNSDPARFLAVTTAPLILDMFHSLDFVFNCGHAFVDRYDGRSDYFKVGERQTSEDGGFWETSLIPDVRRADVDARDASGIVGDITRYQMSGNVLAGHVVDWPVGMYHQAHFHGGGAVLLIVRSEGYTLMWPPSIGTQPYAEGHRDQIVRVDWREGSVFSPPTGWFHQHFNTGPVPARQVALRYGSRLYGVRFHDIHQGEGVNLDVKEGGTMIGYGDEDPVIRRDYQRELAVNNVEFQMAGAFD